MLKACKNHVGVAALLLASFIFAPHVHAHPVAQGAMEIVVHQDHITLQARITLEEILVPSALNTPGVNKTLRDACQKHGEYLLKHIFLSADGKPLSGKLIKFTEPTGTGPQDDRVLFEFEYALPGAPREIALSQDVLNDFEYAPDNPWEASYAVKISLASGTARDGGLLTKKNPLTFQCEWGSVNATLSPAAVVERWQLQDYLVPGIVILVLAAGLSYRAVAKKH